MKWSQEIKEETKKKYQQRIIYSNQWSLSTKKWNEPGKINQIYRRHSSKYAIFKLSSDFFYFIHHIMNDFINIWWIFFLEIALNRHHRFSNHVITNDSEYQMDCTEFCRLRIGYIYTIAASSFEIWFPFSDQQHVNSWITVRKC